MLRRLSSVWQAMRPRAAAQARVDLDRLQRAAAQTTEELKALRHHVKVLGEQQRRAATRLAADLGEFRAPTESRLVTLADEVTKLRKQLLRTQTREAQLRAILRRDVELEDDERGLDALLDAAERHIRHVREAIDAATLHTSPTPYIVVDRLFPPELYQALLRGLPPAELFADKPFDKTQLTVPFRIGPRYARRVWSHLARTLIPQAVMPAALAKFGDQLRGLVRANFPSADTDDLGALGMVPSDGRVMLRTRGYVIPPHRDPAWGFLTGILYLARPGDDERWGTQMYTVDGDGPAGTTLPHWIDASRCRQVDDVRFLPNRMLMFLNASGAHGASIPADAPPALERYIYQFRLGPSVAGIRRLVDTLPEAERAAWRGKVTDY